jgi:hypothetical protein
VLNTTADDTTDSEQQLEDVPEPVFPTRTVIRVHLELRQVKAAERMAYAKSVSPEIVLR